MVFASEGLPYVTAGAQFVGYGSGFHQPTDEEVRAARALAPQPVHPLAATIETEADAQGMMATVLPPRIGPEHANAVDTEAVKEARAEYLTNGWKGGYTPEVQVQPRPEPAPVAVVEPEPRKPGIVLPVGATLVVRIGGYETWSGGVFRVVKPFDAEAFMEERKDNDEEQTVREAVDAGFLQAVTYYGWQMNRAPYNYLNHIEAGSGA